MLTLLGHNPTDASQAAKTFFIHDEQTLKRLAAIRNKEEYVNAARKTIVKLEQIDLNASPCQRATD